jgi:hypothetical protein
MICGRVVGGGGIRVAGWHHRVIDQHADVVAQLQRPGDDHNVARVHTLQHRDLIATRIASGDELLMRHKA